MLKWTYFFIFQGQKTPETWQIFKGVSMIRVDFGPISETQQILKRIGQPCFRTVLHDFLIEKLLNIHMFMKLVKT
jgi:hypothetical protein